MSAPDLRAKSQPLAYSVRDAADTLGISFSKLEEIIKRDDIFVRWIDGKRVIPATELIAYIESLPMERAL